MVKSSISDYTIKAVKEIAFTAVLDAEGIPYKKIGREAVTLCPWHKDNNPSLTISDEKCLCYCFVCQTGDDAIGFIREKLGVSFSEAVQRIASRHEVNIIHEDIDPELAAREAKRKSELLKQLEQQQEFFRKTLKDPRAERIRDLLDERKILPATSKFFGLGYSVNGFFAGRITIPIHDHLGNIVGFTGRATREEEKPKYKNTENNEFFDKSKIVFNEHRASLAIKESDCVIFVEGHFDVISLWQYGISNVVAMQGTAAPSESVINRLARKTKRFILCYDADSGGRKAIEQFIKVAGPMACRGEITISIAHLPEGTDPDQCIRDGSVNFFSIIENSSPWLDWQLEVWLNSIDRSNTAAFIEVEKRTRQLIDSIQSPVLRQFYIDKSSKILAADAESASKIAKDWSRSLTNLKIKREWKKPTPAQTRALAEKRLIRLYIHFPESRNKYRVFMAGIDSPAYRWLWQRIQEVETYAPEVELKDAIMAILAVCEPHYTRQLRPVVMPTIRLNEDVGIMEHIEHVLSQRLIVSGV